MLFSKSSSPPDHEFASPVLAILDRLWQTKMQSISLIGFWQEKTKDVDIRSGLGSQLEDERRHLRMIGDEIKRQGGRITSERREGTVGRAFSLVRSQATDLRRLCAYYRGVKLATHARTGQFVSAVDQQTAGLMSHIARDEERHIRWADIRISRQMTAADMRECNQLMNRMDVLLDAGWQKLWLDLVRKHMRQTS